MLLLDADDSEPAGAVFTPPRPLLLKRSQPETSKAVITSLPKSSSPGHFIYSQKAKASTKVSHRLIAPVTLLFVF